MGLQVLIGADMKFTEDLRDILIEANMWACMRERGKLVPGSIREGHNVFTVTGRNLLSKLLSWQTIGATDIPFTNRRIRWMGVGIGSQLEVTTVSSLAQPALVTSTDFLVPIQTSEFPSSTSVRYLKEFATNEITIAGVPVAITEVGLFADVVPANMGGTEDVGHTNPTDPTLKPTVGSNPPVAYKAFESITKTSDFTLEIRWELRF